MRSRTFAIVATLTLLASSPPVGSAEPAATTGAGAALDIQSLFYPTGWMGDGTQGTKFVKVDHQSMVAPRSGPYCTQVRYTPSKSSAWAGVYWQNAPDNWGVKPGADLSKAGYRRISFWARGENGGEVVEFKAGGIRDDKLPHHDSFTASLGRVTLKPTWTRYTISLEEAKLTSVIGGFAWVAAGGQANKTLTFYIDDIRYE